MTAYFSPFEYWTTSTTSIWISWSSFANSAQWVYRWTDTESISYSFSQSLEKFKKQIEKENFELNKKEKIKSFYNKLLKKYVEDK